MVELLSPVGDFDCLKAAVQNGANAVYFGANMFNARAFATNFDDEDLKRVINYAKIRNVKTHLTLNTCIKESEFDDAFYLAKKAYEFGIDAIIVQDFGLAKLLIENFPDIEIHGSTQMTIHNLEGALFLEKLNFKRAVLARELPANEIKYICENSNIEIETFMHGAICISYSGQCLLSSMIGGRSGNRGKCAQPCRLTYELIQKNSTNKEKILDKGYILSPRDLCTLENLPELIRTGVSSLKIEGRMKSPEYVATVTRIYRKYIDLAYKYINSEIDTYKVLLEDKIDLMQVFNRGGFSIGHLSLNGNRDLVFKEKPNNMGIFLGKVSKVNRANGHICCKLINPVSIGDCITFENETTKYHISELMDNNQNLKSVNAGKSVTIGRMKGNIKVGDKIYKISSKALSVLALESLKKENIQIFVECKVQIKRHKKITIELYVPKFNLKNKFISDYIPQDAQSAPLKKEKIYEQFAKTKNTIFIFSKLEIDLDDNLFLPISVINDIRRTALKNIENKIYNSFKRTSNSTVPSHVCQNNTIAIPKISVLLNILNLSYNYTTLKNIDRIYVPLKYFTNPKYERILSDISKIAKLYVYMPTIIRKKYMDILRLQLKDITKFDISGFVISNLSHIELLRQLRLNKYEIIGNYTLNIYNSYTASYLSDFNVCSCTISPELDRNSILDFCNFTKLNKEMIVYGNTPVMCMNYCPLGKSNKCYDGCDRMCMNTDKYFLKDRLGMMFRLIPDNTQTISTLYNCKILSIQYGDFNVDSVRIDILDEDINSINEIILNVSNNNRFEGKEFTNCNLNREI